MLAYVSRCGRGRLGVGGRGEEAMSLDRSRLRVCVRMRRCGAICWGQGLRENLTPVLTIRPWFGGWIYNGLAVYTEGVGKHLVDIDEVALAAARAELGTDTIKDTVNEALRRAIGERPDRVLAALDLLGRAELDDRQRAWR